MICPRGYKTNWSQLRPISTNLRQVRANVGRTSSQLCFDFDQQSMMSGDFARVWLKSDYPFARFQIRWSSIGAVPWQCPAPWCCRGPRHPHGGHQPLRARGQGEDRHRRGGLGVLLRGPRTRARTPARAQELSGLFHAHRFARRVPSALHRWAVGRAAHVAVRRLLSARRLCVLQPAAGPGARCAWGVLGGQLLEFL